MPFAIILLNITGQILDNSHNFCAPKLSVQVCLFDYCTYKITSVKTGPQLRLR